MQPPGQVGKHGLGEAGAEVSGAAQLAAVVGHAEQERADGARAAALAGFPAADDDLGVAGVLDLDPVLALAGWQAEASGLPTIPSRPRAMLAACTSAAPPGCHGGVRTGPPFRARVSSRLRRVVYGMPSSDSLPA